jgi:hypothetical protein
MNAVTASANQVLDHVDPSTFDAGSWRRRVAIGLSPTALIAVAYLLLDPPSADGASGDFRSRLAGQGVWIWNNLWFKGHYLPGYGLLPPALSSAFGLRAVAVASALAASWCFALLVWHAAAAGVRIVHPHTAVVVFALSSTVSMWGGRLTFGPSVAFAMACMVAAQRDRRVLVGVFGVLCGLSSPVATVSLGIIAAGCWLSRATSRPAAVVAAVSSAVPFGVVAWLFPEGGWYPFTGSRLAILIGSVGFVMWFGRSIRAVYLTGAVYLIGSLMAAVITSPLGGNFVRLGWLLAAPMACLVVARHRSTLLVAFVIFQLIWSWAFVKAGLQPRQQSANASYYTPLNNYLSSRGLGPERVEVVAVETRLQAAEISIQHMTARGWETQVDRKYAALFYRATLDAEDYHRWLVDNAVALVALPRDGITQSAVTEADVVRAGPSFLKPVWSNADWSVYEVADAKPLADNAAVVTEVTAESITVQAAKAGVTTLSFNFSAWYQVTAGDACVRRGPNDEVQIVARSPGTVTIDNTMSWKAVFNRNGTC